MTDANAAHSMRCPNCGAPLDFQPGQTSTRCRFCDSVIERSSDAMTADDHARVVAANPSAGGPPSTTSGPARRFVIKMSGGKPVVIEAGSPTSMPPPMMADPVQSWQSSLNSGNYGSIPVITSSPPVQRSSRLGCILTVVIVAVVVCGVIPAIVLAVSPAAAVMVGELLSGNVQQALGTAGTLGARILVGSSGTLVSASNDGPPEAILLTSQYPASGGNKETRLVDVSTTTRKLNWQSAPLDSQLYDTPILANADDAYILSGQQLMAIHRTDGTTAWQATLADKIEASLCHNCLQLVGTRLVALSTDGTLEVFDAATGKSQWNVKSKQDSPRGLYLLGQRAAFLDRDAKNNGVLRAFDLDTGKETSVQPKCQPADTNIPPGYADWTTPLIMAPKATDFYLIFGFSGTCVQRWDAQNLTMSWSTAWPDNVSGNMDGLPMVFSGDTAYLTAGSNLLAFAIDGGGVTTNAIDPDYDFAVLTTHGVDVIVQAKRTRGTARYEIWAVNGATGQPHWKFNLNASVPMDAGGIIDDNTAMFMTQPSTDGLRVLEFHSAADNKSYKVTLDTLNWDSGQSGGQKSVPLNLDTIILTAPDWGVWKNDVMWMEMNNELLALDTAQNKITYQWP